MGCGSQWLGVDPIHTITVQWLLRWDMDHNGSVLAVILMVQCLLRWGVDPIDTITVQWLLRRGVDPNSSVVAATGCGSYPHLSGSVVAAVRCGADKQTS